MTFIPALASPASLRRAVAVLPVDASRVAIAAMDTAGASP